MLNMWQARAADWHFGLDPESPEPATLSGDRLQIVPDSNDRKRGSGLKLSQGLRTHFRWLSPLRVCRHSASSTAATVLAT